MRFQHLLMTAALVSTTLFAMSGSLAAPMDGPPPPDGPMQGMMHHDRMADRLLAEFDTNHDGKITRAEFNGVLGSHFAAATHGAATMTLDQFQGLHEGDFRTHTEEMYRRIDWKADGRLTLDEFAAPMRAHFEMMDRDGSGVVTCGPAHDADRPGRDKEGEHEHGPRGPFGHRPDFERMDFCRDADADHDGKVTRAELDQMTARKFHDATGGAATMSLAQFAGLEAVRFHDMNAHMFARLDKDNAGKITMAEFSEPMTRLFDRLDRNHDGVLSEDELRAPPPFDHRPGGHEDHPRPDAD